jgi:glycosyltransferase involved in cell wall biosynthesis
MKLIVQIPSFNEETTLPLTVRDIPRTIEGIDNVEILVIDDGSTDRTAEVAREIGVDHIVSFSKNKGLARSFTAGLDASIKLGADIIVNTDADNQYKGEDIPKLIKPILDGKADIVVGDRQVKNIQHFSFAKKVLQKMGSWVVSKLSETDIPDATSGFRAYSKDAALRLNIISPFTYTLESIIQAGKKHITIAHVPIRTNEKLRESRLFKSIPDYIKSLYFYFTGGGAGHIQSLIISGMLVTMGFMLIMIGLVADIISFNRRLIEDTLYRVKKMELNKMSTDKAKEAEKEEKKEPVFY